MNTIATSFDEVRSRCFRDSDNKPLVSDAARIRRLEQRTRELESDLSQALAAIDRAAKEHIRIWKLFHETSPDSPGNAFDRTDEVGQTEARYEETIHG